MPSPCEKLLSLISDQFPEDWYKQFNLEDINEETYQESYNKLSAFLLLSKENFFDLVNTSILTGEYITISKFSFVLTSIKELLAKIPQPLPEDTALQEKLQEDLNRNYIQCLKAAVNMYLDFTIWVSVKLRLSSVEYISQNNEELLDTLEDEEFDDESYKRLAFLQANLMISRIDHFQTPEISDYRYLLNLSRDLLKPQKLGGYKFSILLKEKNDYLLCKWILRKKDISKFPIYHIKNNLEQELDINDLITSPFKEWIEITKAHYQFDNDWKQASYIDFNNCKNDNLQTLTILQLHRLIKYYKDVSKNLSNLTKIRLEIIRRYEETKNGDNSYSKFVYSILVNYSLNNELSLLEESGDYIKILDLYEEILDVQSTTGIRNFFPPNKVISFLANLLESKFREKKVLSDLTELRSIISKCKEIMKIYKKNIDWSEKNYNYVFYLPFEECFINTGNSEIKEIYIASSFVLPLDKTKYIKDYDQFNERIGNVESSLTIIDNVEYELASLRVMKEDVIKVKKELVDKEMKSMETIAIFTTIVTFVLSSVANFKFIINAYQASLFVLCLAVSLGFFVFLMLLIRQGEVVERIRQYIWKLLALIVCGTFLWTILIFSKDIKVFLRGSNNKITNKANPKNVRPTSKINVADSVAKKQPR